MKWISPLLLVAGWWALMALPPPCAGFSLSSFPLRVRRLQAPPLSMAASSEVERLLAKAKALREEAQAKEDEIHAELAQKKQVQDQETDALIDAIFAHKKVGAVVQQLQTKRLCMDTLVDIVDRIYERELIASGKEHVVQHETSSFQRVSKETNPQEAKRLAGMIDLLIDACQVLDDDFKKKKGGKYVAHFEDQHFGGGQSAHRLRLHYHEIRREHEEQFQKRLKEFYDAQRIKDNHKPPPKQKDLMMGG